MRNRARPGVCLDARASVRVGRWDGWDVGDGVIVEKARPEPAKGSRPQCQRYELLRTGQPVHWQQAQAQPPVSGSRRPASDILGPQAPEIPGVPDLMILRLPLSKNAMSQGAALASLRSSSEAPIFSGSDFEGSRPSRAPYPRHLGARSSPSQ